VANIECSILDTLDGKSRFRIAELVLDERTVMRRSPDVEHERKVAIFDLLEENSFAPTGSEGGPYLLHLAIEENRLVFDIRLEGGEAHGKIMLSLSPFRKIIKDYFMICESYYDAIKTAAPAQIEAIDMGRRGLHNEGSELLRERLAGKVEIDFDTSRRLFTLICVLHIKG
tara:strand:+ start:1036 stop:1548 length:513 start_codon:yes stop_codon:yes gene_type:complete